jgi:hypothetical protein
MLALIVLVLRENVVFGTEADFEFYCKSIKYAIVVLVQSTFYSEHVILVALTNCLRQFRYIGVRQFNVLQISVL